MKSSERILERTQFFGDEDEISCKARLLDIREGLPKIRKMEAVGEAVKAAAKRMRRGLSPQRTQFRCSHCGRNTPLLIDGILALADLEDNKINDSG